MYLIIRLLQNFNHLYNNTSMTSLAAQATLHASPASYFVILCAVWLLHPAFLQDRKTPYFLSCQVLKFQTIPSFPSTLSLSALNNPTMAPLTHNDTSASKPPPASSKDRLKNKLVPKLKETNKPPNVTDMLLDNGLTPSDTFEVLSSGFTPNTITPIKANGGGHLNMNLDENGEPGRIMI